MKAVQIVKPGDLRIIDMEKPVLSGEVNVLVRMTAAGICGSDIGAFRGTNGLVSYPRVIGHELAGIVESIPDGNKNGIRPGDRVVVDPYLYCGHCYPCRIGRTNCCTDLKVLGVHVDGGMAEYYCHPADMLIKIPDGMTWEEAAMAEPLACCLHGIDLAGIQVGDKVCVVGGGAIGLLMVQLAKLSGASQIVLSEPNEKRRQVGLQVGANAALDPTRPDAQETFAQVLDGGANVVIECVGNVPAVKSAFQFAGKGATVLLFSVPKVDATFDLPLFDVYKKELTIKGSFVNPDTHARAVALINSGKVDFGPIITHRFTLDQLPEAIAMQMSDASIKVVVEAQ